MKTVDVLQNKDEWYKMRNNFIGASESNIIMGHTKFKTPIGLWKQKIGEAQPENNDTTFIQAKGHRLEEKTRPIIEMVLDTDIKPLVVVSDDYPFLMCSLDGYSEEHHFTWENKFVGAADFEKVNNGEMLMHYYPQVQHQLLLTGANYCVFSVIRDFKESTNPDFPYQYAYIKVMPDHDYIHDELLPALRNFWECVTKKISPEVCKDDVLNLDDDEELTELLGKYQEIEIMKKEQDKIKTAIFKKLGKAKKATCMRVKISSSKSADKEVEDPAAYIKAKNIDLIELGFIKIQKGRVTKRITFPKASS